MGSYEAARKTSKKVINFFVVGLTYGCLDTDTPIPMLRLIAKLEEDNLSGLYMGGKGHPV